MLFPFFSAFRPHLFSFFFFTDTAPTEIYTLSLHDALPISPLSSPRSRPCAVTLPQASKAHRRRDKFPDRKSTRLNSSHRCISYAVFCLKKKKKKKKTNHRYNTKAKSTSAEGPLDVLAHIHV